MTPAVGAGSAGQGGGRVNYHYISGDSHMEVDTANWTPRVPAKHRDRAPKLVRLDDDTDAWFIDGKQTRKANPADLYGGRGREHYLPSGVKYEGTPGTGSPQQRMQEQDIDGVEAEVLFPAQATGPKMWRMVDDDEAYLTIVRAYNDWLILDYCAENPDRLIGVTIMPIIEDLDAHIEELKHCKEMGAKAIMLQDFPSGKQYPTIDDDRFWQTALDLDMPVTVHVDLERTGKGPFLDYPRATPEMLKELEAPGRSFPSRWRGSARSRAVARSLPSSGCCPGSSTASRPSRYSSPRARSDGYPSSCRVLTSATSGTVTGRRTCWASSRSPIRRANTCWSTRSGGSSTTAWACWRGTS